ncbi:MAG: hypothetical protein WC889_19520 [Myxococcota bacterium]|jgi:hypothetical protein
MTKKAVVAVVAAIAVAAGSYGCRLKPMEPEELAPAAGNLSRADAAQLVSEVLRKNGIKCTRNVRIEKRGLGVDADGFDFNMQIGYAYVVKPRDGTAPSWRSDQTQSALKDLEKYQRFYFAFIEEGSEEDVRTQANAFIERLYSIGAIVKAPPPEPPDAGTAADQDAGDAGVAGGDR